MRTASPAEAILSVVAVKRTSGFVGVCAIVSSEMPITALTTEIKIRTLRTFPGNMNSPSIENPLRNRTRRPIQQESFNGEGS
jgi:hypothetical protein